MPPCPTYAPVARSSHTQLPIPGGFSSASRLATRLAMSATLAGRCEMYRTKSGWAYNG